MKIRETVGQMKTASTKLLIIKLNQIIRGWALYHRHICAKNTFRKVDHAIWKIIWAWCVRRHPEKGKKWIYNRYFTTHKGIKWTLFAREANANYYLSRIAYIPIRRYIKIRARANPFVKEDEIYFEKHMQRKMRYSFYNRLKLSRLYTRQRGRCPLCKQAITEQTGWHIHHKFERYKGGSDKPSNLILLHPNCHYQVHHLNLQIEDHVPTKVHAERA